MEVEADDLDARDRDCRAHPGRVPASVELRPVIEH
jgi:hypothetical protein